jgi:uncharacterized RDD family membrane protein YckC
MEAATQAVNTPEQRAGFWRRFVALYIDMLILGAVGDLLFLAATGGFSGQDVRSHQALLWLSLPIVAVYFTLLVGAGSGQTLGMKALGMRVISTDGSGSIGYRRAFIRWIGLYVSMIPFFLGFLWMLWDREKQCWHDKLASDYVVPSR